MPDPIIARHGHRLMSLASLAAFVACMLWLVALGPMLFHPGSTNLSNLQPFGVRIHAVIQTGSVSAGQYLIALLPPLFAVLLPCIALRRVGATLRRGVLLAPELADRLRQLGWALGFSVVLSVLIGPVLAGRLSHGQFVAVGLTTTAFIEIVGALLALSMARVVSEAVRVEHENRSFL